jgi:BASS family bile acid:Na+ symporter
VFERYPDYEYAFASTQLAFAMLGMGATLDLDAFTRVFRRPKALLTGLGIQLVLVPLLAAALARILGLAPGLSVGLVLVAAVPGGSLSNVAVYLGGGNTPLSISLTTVSTLGCLVTAPAVLRLFAASGLPTDFAMPYARVVFEIGVCLLLPLAVGMIVGRLLPARRGPFTRGCIGASLLVIAGMIVGAAGSGRVDAGAYGPAAVAAIGVLALTFQQAAHAAGRAVGLSPADRITVGVEATIRNTNLALLLKASLFPAVAGRPDPFADQVFFVALLYGGMALFVALPPLVRHGRATRARP